MTDNKTSTLLSDVSIEGNLVEKDKLILDAKVSGDIKAEEIITHSKSNILGNIKSKIDWGYAKDYIKAAYKIMQLSNPDVFIIASGKSYSVEYFVKKCFQHVGLNYKKHLKINKKFLRPSKNATLVGDTSKAKKKINFKIETNLEKIISIMMENDLRIEMNK